MIASTYVCLAADISFNLEGLRRGFWQLTIDGLSWGAIYALVAVGYTLVFGVLRLINFAHSEIFMLGMFGAYFCLDFILGFTPSGNAYTKGIALTVLYLGIAMLFAMLVSGSAAIGLEFVAYRPLRRRQRPLADLPDHRDRLFVRATGIRPLRAAEAAQRLWRQQRAAADHPGTAQDSVHHFRRHSLQRHPGDHYGRVDPRGTHRSRDQPNEVRPRHPGRGPGPQHRDADGGVPRAHHHVDVPARRPAGRGGRAACTR